MKRMWNIQPENRWLKKRVPGKMSNLYHSIWYKGFSTSDLFHLNNTKKTIIEINTTIVCIWHELTKKIQMKTTKTKGMARTFQWTGWVHRKSKRRYFCNLQPQFELTFSQISLPRILWNIILTSVSSFVMFSSLSETILDAVLKISTPDLISLAVDLLLFKMSLLSFENTFNTLANVSTCKPSWILCSWNNLANY